MSAKVPVITPTPVDAGITPIPVPGGDSGKIHFVLSASDLPRRERGVLGTTIQDPYVKWTTKNVGTKDLKESGVTKHKVNERNPDWHDEVFSYDWVKGTQQLWHFEVLDYDVLNKDDNMGFADVEVDDFILNRRGEYAVKLSTGGTLFVKQCVPQRFRLSANKLPKLDPFNGLSDPYVKCFWSVGADGPQTLFATTKTIKNVENAVWDEVFEFGNYKAGSNQFWTFKVFDKDPLPKDDVIGEASVDIDKYLNTKTVATFKLSKDEKNEAELVVSPAFTPFKS